MLILALSILLAGLLSGLCSVLEATLLSVKLPSLLALKASGNAGATALLAIRRNRTPDAIGAILIVNTFAVMVGSAFIGASASSVWGEGAVVWTSLCVTTLLLFASEIGPKTYAATHPTALAGFTGRVLPPLMAALAPLLVLVRLVTKLLGADRSEMLTRRGLVATIDAAPIDGALSTSETELLGHIIFVHDVTLEEVHTPLELVVALSENAPAESLLSTPGADAYSRLPLYRGEAGNLVGYVLAREVLRALALGQTAGQTLGTFGREFPRLEETLTIRQATEALLAAREPIGCVITAARQVRGIVTLEDLFEALTGIEITDEPVEQANRSSEAPRRARQLSLSESRRNWKLGPWEDGTGE